VSEPICVDQSFGLIVEFVDGSFSGEQQSHGRLKMVSGDVRRKKFDRVFHTPAARRSKAEGLSIFKLLNFCVLILLNTMHLGQCVLYVTLQESCFLHPEI